jgi:drug/metabolite transporter (DMT)-like permease
MGYSIVDKLAVGSIHPVVYISAMFSLSALGLMPYVLRHRRADCRRAWQGFKPYIGIIGVGSFATYLIILFAFRLGPASYVVAAREAAVVIGALLGRLFLRERFTLSRAAGMIAIVCGLVLVKVA